MKNENEYDYETANATLHALRDLGHKVRLRPSSFRYMIATSDGDLLTAKEIDRIIKNKAKL